MYNAQICYHKCTSLNIRWNWN